MTQTNNETSKIIQTNPMARGPRAAYIHVPFCRKKCGYCDFYSFVATAEDIDLYVNALINEITQMSALKQLFQQRERLDSIYFGGGTPSLLEAEHVQRILTALDTNYGIHDDCEITLEANPDSAESDKFLAYRAAGVNRLSLGVQSLNDHLLQRLERLHDAETARTAIRKARRSGFLNLSVDLMIGLPGQTMDDLAVDLEILLKEDVPHFSIYSLGIEEDTPFYARYFHEAARGEPRVSMAKSDTVAKSEQDSLYAPLPTPEEERAMYHFCREYMNEEGYRHYEVSNFAKAGYASKHNQVYWRAEPYWGFGVSASSYIAGQRCTQTCDFAAYLENFSVAPNDADVANKGLGIAEKDLSGFTSDAKSKNPQVILVGTELPIKQLNPCLEDCVTIDREEAMREFFLLGLRLRDGVSLQAFTQRFKAEIPAEIAEKLAFLVEQDLLVLEEDLENADEKWRLSLKGLDFGNEVFQEFV